MNQIGTMASLHGRFLLEGGWKDGWGEASQLSVVEEEGYLGDMLMPFARARRRERRRRE